MQMDEKLENDKLSIQHQSDGKDYHKQIVENITEVVWITNADVSEIYYMNPAFETVWGHSCESIYKNPNLWAEAIHPDDQAKIFSAFAQGLEKKEKFEFQYRIIRPDGSIRWILDRVIPVLDSHGNLDKITGVSTDITDIRESELLVTEQRKVIAQNSRLIAASSSLASLAHEINQPLSCINLYAQNCITLLKKENITGEIHKSLIALNEEVEHLGQIVHSTKSLLRNNNFTKNATDLNSIIKKVIKLIKHENIYSKVIIEYEPEPKLPKIHASAIQIEQALVNLLSNAIDALENSEKSHKKIRIETSKLSENYVQFIVSNNGPEISQEDQSKILHPFFTTKPQGMGMGLTIVQSIIEEHRGHFQLNSSDEKGTEFSFRLPIHSEERQ